MIHTGTSRFPEVPQHFQVPDTELIPERPVRSPATAMARKQLSPAACDPGSSLGNDCHPNIWEYLIAGDCHPRDMIENTEIDTNRLYRFLMIFSFNV